MYISKLEKCWKVCSEYLCNNGIVYIQKSSYA